jgi:hypothetical protein
LCHLNRELDKYKLQNRDKTLLEKKKRKSKEKEKKRLPKTAGPCLMARIH